MPRASSMPQGPTSISSCGDVCLPSEHAAEFYAGSGNLRRGNASVTINRRTQSSATNVLLNCMQIAAASRVSA